MKVSAQIYVKYSDKGTLKGIAGVCLGSSFLIVGVRIVEDKIKKGLKVFMPSRKLANGDYKDICFPLDTVLYKEITDAVLAAYEKDLIVPDKNTNI